MATGEGRDSESFQTVMRTLAQRLQDSAWTIVYKSLVVLHIMIREGDGNVTIDYLAGHPSMLDCRIMRGTGHYISNGGELHTLTAYAQYLAVRGEEFRSTKHDFIRETRKPVGSWSSKVAGSSLRKLPVEKGLLRLVESVQRQIKSLIHCRFKESEVNNDLIVLGFRMLTTDLLSLYQTLNEGVLNILEHFFELSKVDAERAFKIYTDFTKETTYVIEFLRVAKHLEHITKLHVPTIKHAQTSLTDSLKDYITDPYFEVNRNQYIAEREAKEEKGSGKPVSKHAKSQPKSQPKPQPKPQPVKTQPTQVVPTAATGGLVLQTTGFNPFSGFNTAAVHSSTLTPVAEVPQVQPVVQQPILQQQTIQQPISIPQPMALQQTVGQVPTVQQAGIPPFSYTMNSVTQQPLSQQGVQRIQTTGTIRGNLRKTSTNPFALNTQKANGDISSNPFASTRFSNGSGTTAFSFSSNKPSIKQPGMVDRSSTNPFASAAPAQVQAQTTQQIKPQATAGGLENLPTIPIFPETKKAALEQQQMQQQQMQMQQQIQQQQFQQLQQQQQQQQQMPIQAQQFQQVPLQQPVSTASYNPFLQPGQQQQQRPSQQSAQTGGQSLSSVYTGPNLLG